MGTTWHLNAPLPESLRFGPQALRPNSQHTRNTGGRGSRQAGGSSPCRTRGLVYQLAVLHDKSPRFTACAELLTLPQAGSGHGLAGFPAWHLTKLKSVLAGLGSWKGSGAESAPGSLGRQKDSVPGGHRAEAPFLAGCPLLGSQRLSRSWACGPSMFKASDGVKSPLLLPAEEHTLLSEGSCDRLGPTWIIF